MRRFKLLPYLMLGILVLSAIAVGGLTQDTANPNNFKNSEKSADDFYFVQLTDTHIKAKLFDRYETTKQRLNGVIEEILSFENKPEFIVITGDLVEWGSGPYGDLNCQAFLDCFYISNNQLYADTDFTIPVYTTPGNHDYSIARNLDNYLNYINKKDKYIITHEDTSLFFMNSGPNYVDDPFDWLEILGDGLYDEDFQWIEDELAQCTSTNKIVLMHHPAISDRNDVGEMKDVFVHYRDEFIELCELNNVELVLAGHTHSARVYNSSEHKYTNLPLNCKFYPTLYVQSDDCKEGVHYRNITIKDGDVWLEESIELNVEIVKVSNIDTNIGWRLRNILSRYIH